MNDDEGQGRDGTGDELPEDLDVTAYVGPYQFPDIRRRRIAGTIYAVLAAIALWVAVATGNRGILFGAILLGLIAIYHFLAAWPLRVDQTEALAVASRTVGFPVGHASAQLAWRGLRSRPTWRILLYSAEEPPKRRAFVMIDAVDGAIVDKLVEDNPEEWESDS